MRKLTTREKVLLALCIVGIIGFAYFRYFLTPVESQMATLKSSIDDAQQQVMLLEKTAEQLPQMKIDYNEKLTAFNENKAQYIKESYNQVIMIAQLQEMIDNNGAAGKSVSFSEAEQRLFLEENPELGYYTVENLSLSFVTTEKNWIKILSAFENTYGANKISNFSVNPTGEQTITDAEGNVTTLPSQVSVSMSVEFYVNDVMTDAIEFVGQDQYNYQSNGVFE